MNHFTLFVSLCLHSNKKKKVEFRVNYWQLWFPQLHCEKHRVNVESITVYHYNKHKFHNKETLFYSRLALIKTNNRLQTPTVGSSEIIKQHFMANYW